MNGSRFAGSFPGDARRTAGDTCMECRICWYVYDPVDGDPVWQVAPGTPFAELPGEWRCPQCDGERQQFMVLQAGT